MRPDPFVASRHFPYEGNPLNDPSGTYCLIKYGLYVIPSGFEVKGFPHPPLRKSFVCNDSRNIIYAKHNIFCRKATSFSERKRKRYLRLWRKMVFLPAVGNTTLRVVVPLPPREGRRIPKQSYFRYPFLIFNFQLLIFNFISAPKAHSLGPTPQALVPLFTVHCPLTTAH